MTAFLAGVVSFVSPCVLPLVPAYLSFMTGVSLDRMRAEGHQGALLWRTGLYSLAFVLGFSLVFVLLGASAFLLGQLLLQHMELLSKVGGVIIVLFGLHFMGVFRIRWLNLDARFHRSIAPTSPVSAFLIGLTFAFGWTPCVGPILAAILALAGGQESVWHGVGLLSAYSAGLGVPFVLSGLMINRFLAFSRGMRQHMHRVEMTAGLMLVGVGLLIFFGDLNRISALLLEWFPFMVNLG
jgi:cytochrome c-type biogenesis protein